MRPDPDFAQLRGRIALESDADLDRDQPADRSAVVTVHAGAGTFTTPASTRRAAIRPAAASPGPISRGRGPRACPAPTSAG